MQIYGKATTVIRALCNVHKEEDENLNNNTDKVWRRTSLYYEITL